MTLRTIHLHGQLGEDYGKTHQVDADTTLMIMQGLIGQLGQQFKEDVRVGQFHILKGKRKNMKKDMGEEELNFKLGRVKDLHILPVVEGAGAVVRIVVGVVLVIAGAFFQMPILTSMGASLILGGVVELLTPKPKVTGPTEQAGQNPSFIFNGTVNVTEQGGPVPIVYGRVQRAGSVVLSAGLTVENVA